MIRRRRFDAVTDRFDARARQAADTSVRLQLHNDVNRSAGFVRFRLYTCGEVVQTVPRATGSCLAPQKGGSADGEEEGPRQEGVPGQEVSSQESPVKEEVASTGVILRPGRPRRAAGFFVARQAVALRSWQARPT